MAAHQQYRYRSVPTFFPIFDQRDASTRIRSAKERLFPVIPAPKPRLKPLNFLIPPIWTRGVFGLVFLGDCHKYNSVNYRENSRFTPFP